MSKETRNEKLFRGVVDVIENSECHEFGVIEFNSLKLNDFFSSDTFIGKQKVHTIKGVLIAISFPKQSVDEGKTVLTRSSNFITINKSNQNKIINRLNEIKYKDELFYTSLFIQLCDDMNNIIVMRDISNMLQIPAETTLYVGQLYGIRRNKNQ